MKYTIQNEWSWLLKESARAWNRCEELRAVYEQQPTDENRQALEVACQQWVKASARAGRASSN